VLAVGLLGWVRAELLDRVVLAAPLTGALPDLQCYTGQGPLRQCAAVPRRTTVRLTRIRVDVGPVERSPVGLAQARGRCS
jgi:hypothetical protein